MEVFSQFFYNYLTPIGLFSIMLGLGLTLSIKDLIRVVAMPKAVFIGLFGQMIFLPALAFTLAFVFQPPPIIAIGLILLAACPGGVTSNGYTLVARGDVALSVTLTAFSSFLAVVTMPLFAYLAFYLFSDAATKLNIPVQDMMIGLAQYTVVPVTLGMIVHAAFTDFAKKIKEPVRKIAFALLIGIIVGNTIASWDTLVTNFVKAGVIAAILCFSSMAMGFGLAKLFKLPVEQVITITFEIGIQNLSVVIALAATILKNSDYAAVALVYSLFVKIGPLSFLAYSRKMLADAKKEAEQKGVAQTQGE